MPDDGDIWLQLMADSLPGLDAAGERPFDRFALVREPVTSPDAAHGPVREGVRKRRR